MTRAHPARPGGFRPPTDSVLDGERIELAPLAAEASRRHLTRHPEDVETYGTELAWAWCTHDLTWVLSWAFMEHAGLDDLSKQMRWLATVLGSREYPVENLADALQECGDVVREAHPGAGPVGDRLRAVAEEIRPG